MDAQVYDQVEQWLWSHGIKPSDVNNVAELSKRLSNHIDRSWQTLKRYVAAYRDSQAPEVEPEEEVEGEQGEPKDPRFEQAQDPEDVSPEDLGIEPPEDDRPPIIQVSSKHNPNYVAVMDFSRREYLFDFCDEPLFDVPFDDVQQWIEWYVYKGAGMTQAEVARESGVQLDRPLTEAYFQMVLKALAINKKSTPFAPHMFYEHSPKQLVQGWREQDEALVEQKYKAKQVRWLKRKKDDLTNTLNTFQDFVRRTVAEAELEPMDLQPPQRKQDRRPVEGASYTPGILLGDWHLGKDAELQENVFNSDVAKQRVHRLCDKIEEHFKVYRRPYDRCAVFFLGDMIDGPMGDMHPMHWLRQDVHGREQCVVAANLMAYAVKRISFATDAPVDVYCVAGNHGRSRKNRDEDPIRLAESLTYEIARAWSDVASWKIFDGEMGRCKIRNTTVFLSHGSKTPKDIRKMGWSLMGDNILCLHGHGHTDERDGFSDRHVTSVRNGALCGIDDFEQKQLAKLYRPSQTMVEIYDSGPTYGRMFYLDEESPWQ